jgi:diguanylate cyclase (GGDEF)-like protein/PAS domain S-box-containing protein
VNRAFCDLVGYPSGELLGMSVADITYPDDLASTLQMLDDAVTGCTDQNRAEKQYLRRDDSTVWVSITSSMILDSGENLRTVTQVQGITATKAAEAVLAHRATHDDLTGLLNRTGLHRRLAAALTHQFQSAKTSTAVGPGAVLYCDLDGFKEVNDTHGHAAGDTVLQVVADRARQQVRGRDAVARLGGDEFVIVAEQLDLSEADALATRIRAAISTPMRIDTVSSHSPAGSQGAVGNNARSTGNARSAAKPLAAANARSAANAVSAGTR